MPENGTDVTVTYTKNGNIPVDADDTNPAQKTITRTVTFTGVPDGQRDAYKGQTQEVKFTREDGDHHIGYKDLVTGKVTYNKWTAEGSDKWTAVDTPAITEKDGSVYTPTMTADGKTVTSIDEVTVDPDTTKDSTVTVAYKETTIPVPYKQGKDGVTDGMDEYIKRTITVNYPDSVTGKVQPEPQVVHFTRKDDKGNAGYTTVDANGKKTTTKNDWHAVGSDTWAEFDARVVPGYTANPTKVDAKQSFIQ